ncbi:SixA phosphatase family protein [Mesorhizobium marinum]|uniref:SixA phosphatase family protein n=1 Tax=Mesorhizobium marinum TaxID=3228790 RepID=UPI0034666B64
MTGNTKQGSGSASRLFLLRHAKAGWALPGMRDFDRPLDATGHADAEALGAAMREEGYVPDITLCSGAVRARQTLEGIAGQADTGRVIFCEKLYSEDAAGYLALIQQNAASGSILVIGHNPMMEDLASAISGDGEPEAQAVLGAGFPTSGLAVIAFRGGLANAAPGAGYLEAFHAPARG